MEAVKVWEEIHGNLARFVRSRVHNETLADDILQEVYVKLQTKLPELRQKDKVTGWVFQIARNAVFDQVRFRQRHEALQQALSPPESEMSDPDNLTAEFANCIPAMLQALPPIYQEALYLSEIQGLSQKELAEKLNIPYATAKSRVQRGREKLKEILLDCCHIATDAYGNVIDYHKRKG